MSGRSYLSIGDVLTLLREEFADITISKIRFLESQGLVNPERTPSGYRKFYEHDVERLRWILRQQRENFLPLKVIKGRLIEGGLIEDVDSAPGTHANTGAKVGVGGSRSRFAQGQPLPGFEAARSETSSPPLSPVGNVTLDHRVGDGLDGDLLDGMDAWPDGESSLSMPSMVSEENFGGYSPEVTPSPGGATGASRASHGAPQAGAPQSGAPQSGAPQAGAPQAGAPQAGAPQAGAEPSRPGSSTGRAGHRARPPRPQIFLEADQLRARSAGIRGAVGGTAPGERALDASGSFSGVSLSGAELAAASGTDMAGIEELESYGLIEGRVVAGTLCYDEDALTVARIASALGTYGVEPRHLRMYKNAAEREADLVGQVVMPLLRQRNPEARQRANDTIALLSQHGQALRASLLATALRHRLGG